MKRSVWREKKVDAFSISIDELDDLCSLLLREFGDAKDISLSIELNFPNEIIKFESVNDLKANNVHVNKSTNFSLTIHSSSNYFVLKYSSGLGSDPSVRSSSDSEAWCAGINDVAISCLRRYRVWYYWAVHRFFWWPVGILLYALTEYLFFVHFQNAISSTSILLTIIFLSFLFHKHRLFPCGAIRIHQKKRNIKTILLIISITGIIIGIISNLSAIFGATSR